MHLPHRMSKWDRAFVRLGERLRDCSPCDPDTLRHVERHITDIPALERDPGSGLIPKQMFWPPRIVRAVKSGSLLVFFGSGVSLAADLPSWMGLLRAGGLKDDYEKDPHVNGDMLTLAELAAHTSGAGTLQDQVRAAMDTKDKAPTTAHSLLAAMSQSFYITTNYDDLFEKAWHRVHGIVGESLKKVPVIVTTDDDVRRVFGVYNEEELEGAIESISRELKKNKNCVLFKIHGSVSRPLEYLVLTRSDYRRHYRTNRLLFAMVKRLMSVGHTLFLGFGHRDPEIVRLIDDVVHNYESSRSRSGSSGEEPEWPGIYSLQFDMLQKTPEVFAARGIVALQPPLIFASSDQEVKGFRLAQGLVDLLHNTDWDVHENLSLDDALRRVSEYADSKFAVALSHLGDSFKEKALSALDIGDEKKSDELMEEVLLSIPEFGNQGAYLVQADGVIAGLAVPAGLNKVWRLSKAGRNLGSRPYFRQANSLRQPFVSDSFPSQFNNNSTIALCLPLLREDQFAGLLFTAHQFRDSDPFLLEVQSIAKGGRGTLLMVDSNGILLFPPEREFDAYSPASSKAVQEKPGANKGFEHNRLLYLSRRDKRVERISSNVVPLAQDDDVFPVALDATVYTVLTELRLARWKVALTRFFPSKFQVGIENK